MQRLLEKIREILRNRRTRMFFTRFVSLVAAIVVFITTYALVLPAITLEKTASCGIEEHQHSDNCYEDVLTCGQEESEGHHHDDSCYTITKELECQQEEHQHSQEDGCYDEEGNLICERPEHVHDDACFSEVKTLSCGREESEGHRHSDACYKKVLACGKEAHTHSDGCYADDGDAEEPDEEAAAQASSVSMPEEAAGEMTAEAAAEETLSGDYVPELDSLNIEAVFGKKTGFYYFHADEGQEVPANSAEITDWLKVTEDTELAPTDLVKMYLPYSVPAGSLNETNPTARYRLPENIHLTDEQIDAINENENGIVAGYAESDPEYQLYLGAEAIEGDRTPDEILQDGAQEYISAVVRAVNVYENNEYIGQDLISTVVPYSIEKNQIIYDEENNPISAGEKITGWFTCDFRMDQIDWVEEDTNEDIQEDEEIREKAQQETDQNSENDPAADSYSDSDPVDESENVSEDRSADQSAEDAAMNTVEKTAEVLFVSEDKDEDIEEIKRTLRLVEKKEDSVSDEEESETETPQFQSGTLTADGDGYKITLDYTEEAKIPENASLSVREITAETDKEAYEACLAQAQQHVNESGEARSTVDSMASRFFDIEIQVTDEEGTAQKIEPAAPVSVNIQISEIPADMSDADSEIESGETQNSDPTVLHFAEDGVEQVEAASESVSAESGSETASDDSNATEVRFEAESFSIYGVVYTVDFHWEVDGKTYEFSIPGGGFVSLQKLLEVLGVARNDAKGETANTVEEQGEPVLTLDDVSVSGETKKFVVDVKKVDFSRPELVWVEKVEDESTVGALKETNGLDVEYSKNLTEDQIEEINAQTVEAGDWALISMQPFTSEETLTVTMKDGEVFTILVTDAQIKKTVISASGETYEITVTYGEDAKLPDGAELAVREILPGEEEYEKDCVTADKALRAKYDRGLATHTVIFDISITADGEIVEPAEGSTVSVEIKLVESLLSDNEAGESENRTSTLDSQTESSKDISVEALDEDNVKGEIDSIVDNNRQRYQTRAAVNTHHSTYCPHHEISGCAKQQRTQIC